MEEIDLTICTKRLCDKLPSSAEVKRLRSLLSKETWTENEHQVFLQQVSQLLLRPIYTVNVAAQCSGFILELLIFSISNTKLEAGEIHEQVSIVLGQLVGKYPHVARYCIQYFEKNPSLIARIEYSNEEPPKKKSKKNKGRSPGRLGKNAYYVLKSAIQLLCQNRDFFSSSWDWSPLVPLCTDSNAEARWLVFHCLAVVIGMPENYLMTLLKHSLNEEIIFDLVCRNRYLLETQHPSMICKRDNIVTKNCTTIRKALKTDSLSIVCGVALVKCTENPCLSSPLVLVPSVTDCLRQISLAISAGEPCLIQGPVGCGKSLLVQHLAGLTGRLNCRNLIKVQMGDQVDSKILVGIYCCTNVPGEFIWKAGPLTRAMEEGHWLLLEDIDYAPQDVVSILVPVLKSGTLVVPGQAKVLKAAPGFMLFATRRLVLSAGVWHSESRGSADLLSKVWKTVTVPSLSEQELLTVILTRWPQLEPLKGRIIEIFRAHSEVLPATTTSRPLTIRDLTKWCSRISSCFNVVSLDENSDIFLSALDCFCYALPDVDARLSLAAIVGEKLNLPREKTDYYCQNYIPELKISADVVQIGRFSSKVKAATFTEHGVRRTLPIFAQTRQALVVLESVAVAVSHQEAVLLVGETGTGKTSVVQYLAHISGKDLTVINMNQQSDSTDLLGGYKPVDLKVAMGPLREDFETIFRETFPQSLNTKFLMHIMNCFANCRWEALLELMMDVYKRAINLFQTKEDPTPKECSNYAQWKDLGVKLQQLKTQVKQAQQTLVFSFIKGTLVKAVETGCWILLDEINLAEDETLECLAGLLDNSSITLIDSGNEEEIKMHPDFRLFACMNPATDVGKKDLPPGIRNRFTEIFMGELEDKHELLIMVKSYLQSLNLRPQLIDGIVTLYLDARKAASTTLVDGTGHAPHFSLRTLCRALSYASTNPCQRVLRSLYEAFCLSFLTQLSHKSCKQMEQMIGKNLLGKERQTILNAKIPEPPGGDHLSFEGYWIKKGERKLQMPSNYILTSTIRQNLLSLARVVSARRHPVLLQGETSVGKTSLIEWLAQASGHVCIRVNNHEHTDLQEYVGSYVANHKGKLIFQEGVLVEAMRNGFWIILDELNLAPTEVLEALNRVLDDNRELFISETQTVVKAHPQFMLFATQNPPGQYGGRKVLSRAFRNRFVELHFEEIPREELQEILHKRCALPQSYCKQMVAVMHELQIRRRESGVFAGKQGFITLRDLFRWGERYHFAKSPDSDFYDWAQYLADQGYMLLAGRVRRSEEAALISDVIKKHMKRTVDPQKLFSLIGSPTTSDMLQSITRGKLSSDLKHIVWTGGMTRMAALVGQALYFGEPVLLVGDTGCGKTTICQILSGIEQLPLFIVNCHMHSEGADFLGSLRPVRCEEKQESGKLFEWVDGPLVKAMILGAHFLVDEISLADDSVLERLNSVLESDRTLLMAEKGGEVITAQDSFRFLATMNPGGDYGKKELSPALRNRFTEIWCPNDTNRQDFISIVDQNTSPYVKIIGSSEKKESGLGQLMVDFLAWFTKHDLGQKFTISIRDILTWIQFINHCVSRNILTTRRAYINGACLVFLDAIGSGRATLDNDEMHRNFRKKCLKTLKRQSKTTLDDSEEIGEIRTGDVIINKQRFGIHPFYIEKGPNNRDFQDSQRYSLTSPTPNNSARRLLRALQMSKPILLEGAPGVGKTTLVAAIAKASGNALIRINLSEQTDVSELFGADLPVEGGHAGQFVWRDGPILQALKSGHWILLDELNLASQSVLEGLNACLDHRGEIYIPELDKSFLVPFGFTRIFSCQNPQRQGGARKGLPRSFLNRFIQVYIEPLPASDLQIIAQTVYPNMDPQDLNKMIAFNKQLEKEVSRTGSYSQGGPWEFNLRDIFRWCHLLESTPNSTPGQFVELIYADRMRSVQDKCQVLSVFQEIFAAAALCTPTPTCRITSDLVQLGGALLPRKGLKNASQESPKYFLHYQRAPLASLAKCIEMNWMAILVGGSDTGKTSIVQLLATLTGHPLSILTVNSEMDTTELLGGFEQVDLWRHLHSISQKTEQLLQRALWDLLCCSKEKEIEVVQGLLSLWAQNQETLRRPSSNQYQENSSHIFLEKINGLKTLLHHLTLINKSTDFEKSKISNIENQLLALESRFSVTGQMTDGGTFEWVDSILVNALQDGHWLLLDNVNFCSSSVLDRLNPLLEPDGVLTVTEKGFVDGLVPTIKPHPDFRLILAMDPKNGEISRAMRNRGVEIYILGEADGRGPDAWDQLVLLKTLGITDSYVAETLVKIHDIAQEHCIGAEKPSHVDLLKAANTLMSYLQFGSTVTTSLSETCRLMYLQQIREDSIKEQVATLMSEEISNLDVHMEERESSNSSFGDQTYPLRCTQILHHPSAAEFQMSSLLATGHSQGAIIVYILRSGVNACMDTSNFGQNYALPPLKNVESFLHAFRLSVILYMENSSKFDWQFRLQWIQTLVSDMSKPEELQKPTFAVLDQLRMQYLATYTSPLAQQLVELNYDLVHAVGLDLDDQKIPFDLHCCLALKQKLFLKNDKTVDKHKSISNRLRLLCKLLWMVPEHTSCPARRATRNVDNPEPHPVLSRLSLFFRKLNQAMVNILEEDKNWFCSDAITKEIADALYRLELVWTIWRQLQRSGSSLQIYQERLSLLWTWANKYANPIIQRLNPDKTLELQQSANLLNALLIPNENKLRKRMARIIGAPLPLASAEAAQLLLCTASLEEKLKYSVLLKREQTFHAEFLKSRPKWIQTIKEALLSSDLFLAFNALEETQNSITELENSSTESSGINSKPPAVLCMQVQLLPLVEPLVHRLVQQVVVCCASYDTRNETVSFQDKKDALLSCPYVETVLSPSLLKSLSSLNGKRKPSLELLLQLLDLKVNHPGPKFQKELLLWGMPLATRPHLSSHEKTVGRKKKSLAIEKHQTVSLSVSCIKLLGQDSENSLLPLGMASEKHDQLTELKDLLWRNTCALNCHTTSEWYTSINLVHDWFNRLVFGMISIISTGTEINTADQEFNIEILHGLGQEAGLPDDCCTYLRTAYSCIQDLKIQMNDGTLYNNFEDTLSKLGFVWMLVGYATMQVFMPRDPVDPVLKWMHKVDALKQFLEKSNLELSLRDWLSKITFGFDLSKWSAQDVPFWVNHLRTEKEALAVKVAKFDSHKTYRPELSQFEELTSSLRHLLNSECSSMSEFMYRLYKNESSPVKLETLILEMQNKILSLTRFLNDFLKKHRTYQDLIVPFCLGLVQLIHGCTILKEVKIDKLIKGQTNLQSGLSISDFCGKLVSFPYINKTFTDSFTYATFLSQPNTILDAQHLIHNSVTPPGVTETKLLKSALIELCNHSDHSQIIINKFSSGVKKANQFPHVFRLMDNILYRFAKLWTQEEEARQEAKIKEESLFQFKSHEGELSDEEQIKKEIQEKFPSYKDEFESERPAKSKSSEKASQPTLTSTNLLEFWQLHCQLVMNQCTLELQQELKKTNNFLHPFMLRYSILCDVIGCSSIDWVDGEETAFLNSHILACQSRLMSLKQQYSESKEIDVYREAMPSEAKKCRLLLEDLQNSIGDLLIQFPEHPTLCKLQKIILRILDFPVTNPLMKFVTGLEVVLTTAQDWESAAHRGIKLQLHLTKITAQIVEWRKLELKCWASSLEDVVKNNSQEEAKSWCRLYCLLKESDNNDTDSLHKYVEILIQVVEDSTLGQFEAKLHMLNTFIHHCQLHPGNSLEQLGIVFSNVHNFFQQFQSTVLSEIVRLKQPIEKQLKDYVKIAKWNDVNYWSVMQSVEKSHRTVYRHTKDFQKCLQQHARKFFAPEVKTISAQEETTWEFSLNHERFVSTENISKALVQDVVMSDSVGEDSPLHRISQICRKLRKICQNVLKISPFPDLIDSLNGFAGDIVETSLELQKHNFENETDKKKRKSLYSNLHARKRRSLSDLFKMLHTLGLSYRKGLTYCKLFKKTDLMMVPPLSAQLFQDMSLVDSEVADQSQKYYYKCGANFSLLLDLLQTPAKILELAIIQRCQGFSGHLMQTISENQKKLFEEIKKFSSTKAHVNDIMKIESIAKSDLPPQKDIKNLMEQLKTLVVQSIASLQQAELVLSCCPDPSNKQTMKLTPWESVPPIVNAHKGDETWTKCQEIIRKSLDTLMKIYLELESFSQLYIWEDVKTTENIFIKLTAVANDLTHISSRDFSGKCSLTNSINFITHEINQQYRHFLDKLTEIKEKCKQLDESDDTIRLVIEKTVDQLVRRVLLATQKLHQMPGSTETEGLSEEHLTDKLYSEVFRALEYLELSKVENLLSQLMSKFAGKSESSIQSRVLCLCRPILSQYLKLCEYYLLCALGAQRTSCKLLYILLGVFNQMAQKGFCLPSDLEEAISKEAGTQFQEIEEGGLGEGEGTKDVSDRLESEDQLDEAMVEGEDKKQDEKKEDLKEEENGIEMSENFDGELEDLETKEVDEEEKDDEDTDEVEELDQKEMGQVDEPDPNKLDQQLWGSDDESEGETKDDNEFGGGAEMSAPELVAKEGEQEESETGKPPPQEDENQEDEYDGEKYDPYKNAPEAEEPPDINIPDQIQLDENETDEQGEKDEEAEAKEAKEGEMEGENLDEIQPEEEIPFEGDAVEEEEIENADEEKMEEEGKQDELGEDMDIVDPATQDPEQLNDQDHLDLKASGEEGQTSAEEQKAKGSQDRVLPSAQETLEDQSELPQDETQEEGAGGADTKKDTEGHQGGSSSQVKLDKSSDPSELQQNLGRSHEKRSISTLPKQPIKRLKTQDHQRDIEKQIQETKKESELYEHLQDDDTPHDAETLDLATDEQALEQPMASNRDDSPNADSDNVKPEANLPEDLTSAKNSLPSDNTKDDGNKKQTGSLNLEDDESDDIMEIEGEIAATSSAARSSESSIHTRYDLWAAGINLASIESESWNINLSSENGLSFDEAQSAWRECDSRIRGLVQELCEQLRLVLEPTKTSKMRGDYRTGKRLNMRKIIPYIASQFRKDKIWLRRTKPSKREYHIVIAVDDSSSMADNHSRQMAFETLSLLGRSLNLLEAGELAVISFGEEAKLIHPFGEPFTDSAGVRILQNFKFGQKKTCVAQFLDYVSAMLSNSRQGPRSMKGVTQLVVIISDGRGIYSEGQTVVTEAVRRARGKNIFIVFVILDNPQNQNSILDIQSTNFTASGELICESYIEKFPFPFYVILRDISSMPVILGEALRQWFELVTTGER